MVNHSDITLEILRDALKSWRSAPELGQSPLARLQIVTTQREAINGLDTLDNRGQALRAVLREAIYTFPQPANEEQAPTHTERPFYLLTQRFIEGYGWKYVAEQMGLARRTFYEEQARAIKTLLEILQQREAAAINGAQPVSRTFIEPPSLDEVVRRFNELPLETIPEPAALPSGSVMPLERNPFFVGREHDLLRLGTALKGGETVAIGQVELAATTGVGGIGKTQLASEFVHRYGQFFGGGVFWLSFAEAKAIPSEIAACGGPGRMDLRPNFSDLSLDDQLNLVQGAWQEPIPRLLVFDNCEDPKLLQQWRPTSGGCRILITSRRATWDPFLGVEPLPLDVLSRAESLSLLQEHCPTADITTLDAIAEELGDLPLALHLAGSYMARYRLSVSSATYLAELKKNNPIAHPSFVNEDSSPTDHVQNVRRTFNLSYQKLDPDNAIDALAIEVLARVVHFARGEPIPYHLLTLTLDMASDDMSFARHVEDAVNRLVKLGLLEVWADHTVRQHRLLNGFVREAVSDDLANSQTAVEQAILAETERQNKIDDANPILPWQPHLRAITDAALVRQDELAASLCNQLGYHLRIISDFAGAKSYWEQTLEIRQCVLGENNLDTAESFNNVGVLLVEQGKLAEAVSCLRQSLLIRQNALSQDHPDVGESFNNIGFLLQQQGNVVEAQAHYEQAIAIWQKHLEPNDLKMAYIFNNLGYLLYGQEEFDRAEPYYHQALDVCKNQPEENMRLTAVSLNNLGMLYLKQEDLVRSKTFLEDALTIRQALGEDFIDTAESLKNMGSLLQIQGEIAQACSMYKQAITIYEQVLGGDHATTVELRNSLSELLTYQPSTTCKKPSENL